MSCRSLTPLLILIIIISINISPTTSSTDTSKILFTNGNIITMEPDGAVYSTVLAENGIITEVSNSSSAMQDPEVRKIDLDGRTLLPGFIDSHAHWIGDRDLTGMTADQVIETALSYGWTTISEQFVNQHRLDELVMLDTQDRLRLRVNAFLPLNYQEQRFGEWYLNYSPHQMMSEKVRIAGVKFFMDNGPYFNNINRSHWFEPTELNPLIQNAHDNGFQISIHSFIDNATDTALDALELAQGDNSEGIYRHRIEHASFLRDDQLVRLEEMNTIISAQFLWHSSDWADMIYQDTQADPQDDLHLLVARWRDVLDAGITLIGSTDTPWGVPDVLGSSTLAMSIMTTRVGVEGINPPQWMLDQTITIDETLRAMTIEAAYGVFEEDVKGSIAVGKLADYVVLSENPLEVDPSNLANLDVDMTVVGGTIEYCRGGLEEICEGTFDVSSTSNPSRLPVHPFSLVIVLLIVYQRRRIIR